MEEAICLAVVQSADLFYSFLDKQSFVEFCESKPHDDKILVILTGGSHKSATFGQIRQAEWVRETPL